MNAREVLVGSCLAVVVALFAGAFDTQLWAQAEKPAPVVITEDTTWSGSVTADRPVRVQKGTLSIAPGTKVTFKADGLITVLESGALVARGSKKKPVRLAGEASGGINLELGRIVLEHCHVIGLSRKVGKHLQWLTGKVGTEGVILRRCTFTDCGGISLSLSGPFEMSGCDLRNCRGNIRLTGKGKAVVSENTMQGGGLSVGSGADVLIAGNVVIGGTVSAFRADKAVIEDNYVHQPLGKGTYGLLRVGAITRNNVVRGGTWVTARMGGQITDNVFISIQPEEILKAKKSFDKNCTHEHICGLLADSRVIRNIFVGASYAGIMGIGHGTGSDSVIRNNTFDMHGRGSPVTLNHFPENNPKNIRIRNNIFMRCGPVWNEWGRPGSISSVDYNLWSDAGKKERFKNFKGATVVGKKPGEAGFGGHDVPSFTELKKVLPPESIVVNPDVKFPFTDEEILARKHIVAEILKTYRDAYTLKADSPAINAGDPADKDDPTVKDGKPDIGALERTGLRGQVRLISAQLAAQVTEGGTAPRKTYVVPTHPRIAFRKDDLTKLRRRCLTTHAKEYAVLKSNSDRAAFLGTKAVAPGLLYQLTGESRYLQFARGDYDAFHEVLSPDQAGAMANDILYRIRRQMSVDGNIGKPIKGGDGTGFTTHSLQMSHVRSAILPILGDDVPIAFPGEMEKRLAWLSKRVGEMRQIYNTVAYRRGGKSTSFHCACFFGRMPNFFEAWRVLTGENYFGDPLLAGFILQPMHNTLPHRHDCAPMTNSWGHDHLGRPADYILAARARDGLCQWVIHNPEWVTGRPVGRHDPADFDALGRAWLKGIDGLGGYKEHKWAAPVAWWTGHMPSRILYYDPSLKEVSPDELPTSALFEGLGMVCMRNSWDDDAVFGRIHSGPNFRGEPPHLNDNTFVIYHKGWLVKPERSTHKLTSYASSVLVKDPNEKIIVTGKYTGALDWNALWDGKLSDLRESKVNDGGQSYWKAKVERLNTKVRGKITAYEAGELFTYSVGDATQSYNPAKLKHFTRQFLYLKPGFFIIFDRVDSKESEFEKRWVLHTKGKPEKTGDGKVIMADAVSTAGWSARGYNRTAGFAVPKMEDGPPRRFILEFETAWDGMDVGIAHDAGPKGGKLKWSLDDGIQKGELNQHSAEEEKGLNTVLAKRIPKGKHTLVLEELEGKLRFSHFTIRMGGRLFVTTLLPKKFKREVTANKIATRDAFNRQADWRIDVIPEEARTDDVFLNVLEATDVSKASPVAVKLTSGDDRIVMKFEYEGRSYEVTFNRTGNVGGHLKIGQARRRALVDKALAPGIVDGPDAHIERCRRLMREEPEYDYRASEIAHLTPMAETADLLKAMRDKRWYVRFYAVRALGLKSDRSAVGELIRLLRDQDTRVAGVAAEALGRIKAKEAIGPLALSLGSKKTELRLYAASALGELGAKGSLDGLVKLLADRDDFVSASAAEALGKLGDEKAAGALGKAIDSADTAHMKASYLWALASVGGDTARKRLEDCRKNDDATVRACAVSGLVRLLGKDAGPILKDALKDESGDICSFARRKLAEFGDESILSEYVAAAKNEKLKFSVRAAGLKALGDLGNRKVIDDIVPLLDDQTKQGRSDTVSANAALALHKLGDKRGLAYLKKALMQGADKSKQHVAESAAAALGLVDEKLSVPILMEGLLLKKQNWQVKPAIVSSLYKATRQDPAGELQYLNWDRFNRDAKCWMEWWEKNKAAYTR